MSRAVAAPAAASRRRRAGKAAARRPASAPATVHPHDLPGYLDESLLPLPSLVLLLPLLVVYELGTWHFATDPLAQTERRVRAFQWMQEFFSLLGVTGRYLPALTMVGALLGGHIARRDPWRVRGRVLVGMATEGLVWALPMLVIGLVAVRLVTQWLEPLSAPQASGHVAPLLVLSVGAGLYEELIFRLLPFALLGLVLNDWLGVSKLKSAPLVVGFCAVLFALYHYLGGESFTWPSLGFRLFAGGYLGLLLLCRGFGITACCHIAYDVIVVLLQAWATR